MVNGQSWMVKYSEMLTSTDIYVGVKKCFLQRREGAKRLIMNLRIKKSELCLKTILKSRGEIF
jgi:hypothetical protein